MTPPDTSRQPATPAGPARPVPDSPTPGSGGGERPSVTLLMFAAAREAAGCSRWELESDTVAEVLDRARQRFGASFAAVLDGSKVWLNGEPAVGPEPLSPGDEVAVLPPVSGG